MTTGARANVSSDRLDNPSARSGSLLSREESFADQWLWDGEFRAGDPALIPMRKRQARAWQHAEMMEDERELGELWRL